MKPIDLYNAPPEEENKIVSSLAGCYYNHVPEIEDLWGKEEVDKANTRVTIKVIKHWDFDFRRYWRLATVWLDDKPVMVIQNAGREGDDHSARFITDVAAYQQMVLYIKSIMPVDFIEEIECFNLNEDIEGLEVFYGNSLNGYFEKHY